MTGDNIQETSRSAYYKDAIPTLSDRQKAVYDALVQHGPMTNLELAYQLHRAINTITPRTNELVKLGVVHEEARRPCRKSGRMAIVWDVAEACRANGNRDLKDRHLGVDAWLHPS